MFILYNTLPKTPITKILLEKYEIDVKDTSNMKAVKDAIDQQQVMPYIGANTSYISSLFPMGGGDIYVEAKLIEITKAAANEYPFIIDTDTDTINKRYVYRVLNYAPGYESATRYVSGLSIYEPLVPPRESAPYVEFLDMEDYEELLPDNALALIEWLKYMSLFHETYRLRSAGEIEDFKFSTYKQRAWMSMVFSYYLEKRNLDAQSKIIGVIKP